jgi:nanoRNase/pAp phosphatase (c-di-AMP/oligoRNAs hydrolase)
MRSEAGFYLGAKYPFSITYDDKWNEGKRYYSLRSRKKGGLDLVRIGKVWGGGGHAHATGFNRPIDEPFPFDFVNDAQLELELELEPT